jgi:predicted ATPase
VDRVSALSLKDFTAFDEARFDFSPGINVLIGANATGKSHVMKVIYSVVKAGRQFRLQGSSSGVPGNRLEVMLAEKLHGVFKPDGRIGRLVTRAPGRERAEVCVEFKRGRFLFDFDTSNRLTVHEQATPQVDDCLFLPTRELLSMYPGFIAAYKDRELSFDETYCDLCIALSAMRLRGPRLESARKLVEPLEQALLTQVVLKEGRFDLQSRGESEMEAHLAAEGFRKLGSLKHLLLNGSLNKDSILFWDEPEVNLNPRLITAVVQLLSALAAAGVQTFIATHDYLLVNELSLAAEYETAAGKAAKTRFICLTRDKPAAPIEVHSGNTIAEIEDNPILEEFAAHYEREQALFHGVDTK